MKEYELVHEIKNCCKNNQMRDVFISEVETDDPVAYVKSRFPGKQPELTVHTNEQGNLTVDSFCDGMIERFIFTPI